MSFPPGTEMFQFPGFASPKPILFSLVILFPFNPARAETRSRLNGESGFPHSEICGSKVAHTSPQLIAACHVLHRLCMPRHPRIALTSRLRIHTTNDSTALAGQALLMTFLFAQLDNHFVVGAVRPPASRSCQSHESDTATASISRTHSQCQRSAAPKRHLAGRSRI